MLALDRELRRVVEAVKKTGKRGSLTLRLKVEVADRQEWDEDARQVVIVDEISVKEPRPSRAPTIFYALKDGGLSKRDPGQLTIDDLVRADNKTKAAGK